MKSPTFFKKNPTIEKIIAPINKIMKDLEIFASEQEKSAEHNANFARELEAKSAQERESAEQARTLAKQYSTLTIARFTE